MTKTNAYQSIGLCVCRIGKPTLNESHKTKHNQSIKLNIMNKLQLFVILQDTVSHITMGIHLAPNYHHVKQEVISMFPAFKGKKRLPSKKLLVLIGEVYIHYGWKQEFNDYMYKQEERHAGLCEMYDNTSEKMFQSQA